MAISYEVSAGTVECLGDELHVACIGVKGSDLPSPAGQHTILVLDCSYSMSASIDQMRRDAAMFVSELTEKDWVTVFIFSGHNTAEKIAGPVRCEAAGREMVCSMIESKVGLIGTTVFSEALEKARKEVEVFSEQGILHSTVLFTDGVAVPSMWTADEEQTRSQVVVSRLTEGWSVFSVVGYGVHYDAWFLQSLVAKGGHSGLFYHISDIGSFATVVREIREVLNVTGVVNLEITVEAPGTQAVRVFKLEPDVALIGSDGSCTLPYLHQGRATLFVEFVGHADSLKLVTRVEGGETVEIEPEVRDLSAEETSAYVRVLAYLNFQFGNTKAARTLLEQVGDLGLAERAAGSYSDREKRETAQMLRSWTRTDAFIGAGLKPRGPNNNVLNVLAVLVEDPSNEVFIPSGGYRLTGMFRPDPRVIESPGGRDLKVTSARGNKKRHNFSLTALKRVKITPEGNPEGPAEDAQIWRSYVVIKDGNLHLDTLKARLSRDSFDTLQAAEVISGDANYQPNRHYTLKLSGMKLVSSAWAHPGSRNLGLVRLLRREKDLMAEQTALNARRKAVGVPTGHTSVPEELEGADPSIQIYQERPEKPDEEVLEYYDAACCEYRLMKYKAAKPPEAVATMTFKEADDRVSEVRAELRRLRFRIHAIVFALEAVSSQVIPWGQTTTTQRGKDPKEEQTATYEGATLKRVTWTEAVACSS